VFAGHLEHLALGLDDAGAANLVVLSPTTILSAAPSDRGFGGKKTAPCTSSKLFLPEGGVVSAEAFSGL